jgi:predicted nucleotidyltransferase
MIDQKTIDQAVARLLQVSPPGSQVILFGSYARGDAAPESDLDFLVIQPSVDRPHEEMVRLAEVLRPLQLGADVLVISQKKFEYWRDTPNTVYFDAAREGKTYGQVA